MIFNKNIIKGKWRELKGDLQNAWGKLMNNETDKSLGDLKSITGLIQQNFGQFQKSVKKGKNDIKNVLKNNKKV